MRPADRDNLIVSVGLALAVIGFICADMLVQAWEHGVLFDPVWWGFAE